MATSKKLIGLLGILFLILGFFLSTSYFFLDPTVIASLGLSRLVGYGGLFSFILGIVMIMIGLSDWYNRTLMTNPINYQRPPPRPYSPQRRRRPRPQSPSPDSKRWDPRRFDRSVARLSRDHQEILEAIRTEDTDATIRIAPLAEFKRLSIPRTKEIIRKLIDLKLVSGRLTQETLQLHESRILCQLCDTEYTNPREYYQCPKCHRNICGTCARQLDHLECIGHPQTHTPLQHMPVQCSTCQSIIYNLKSLQSHQNCPHCGTLVL